MVPPVTTGPFETKKSPSFCCCETYSLIPHLRGRGQNWQYDYQYIAKYFGFEVNITLDIMSEHHVQQPALAKGLDFQSSIYRPHHVYWKDAGKERGGGNDRVWWKYNCIDCVATFEIGDILLASQLFITNSHAPSTEPRRRFSRNSPTSWPERPRAVSEDYKLAAKMASHVAVGYCRSTRMAKLCAERNSM